MNLHSTLVPLKLAPHVPGGLDLCTPEDVEAGLGVDAIPLKRARELFGFGSNGLPPAHANPHQGIDKFARPAVPEGQLGVGLVERSLSAVRQAQGGGVSKCGPEPSFYGYTQPGVYGACRIQGKGIGSVALHRNIIGTAAATPTAVSPARRALITRLTQGGANPDNQAYTVLNVNQDQLLHGGTVPGVVFSPKAAHPIPFSLALGTQDVFNASSREVIPVLATGPILMSGDNCFDSRFPAGRSDADNWRTLDYPCEPMGKGSRQIILGIAAPLNVAENNGVGIMQQAPATLIRMGAIAMTGVKTNAAGAMPVAGRAAAQGGKAVEWLDVTQVDVNGVEIFTSPAQVAAAGGIGATQFHPESGNVWYPDFLVSPADNCRISLRNGAPAAANANDITAIAAMVGCERVASC